MIETNEQKNIPPLITFSTINNISTSVNRSILLCYFSRLLSMLTLVRKENEQHQAYISQGTSFESFQIHQLTKMYRFEHKNHNNLRTQGTSFESFQIHQLTIMFRFEHKNHNNLRNVLF